MVDYNKLSPEPVFRFFGEISRIPRGSGNEKAVSDYLVKFAKDRGLEVIQDKALNVIIKKPGTPGYENAPTVIIQGHMDMVCEKNRSKEHDFEKDPIELRVDGDMLYANGTTLGADDGIATAYAMALLDSHDIPHPPLEVLMTTDEEMGLLGATELDFSNLEGRYLINIDSEEEGYLLAGCAGGNRVREILPIAWEGANKDYSPWEISIQGLKGGHSGSEIHKGRGNSNKLLGRLLYSLTGEMDFYIKEVNGGLKMNAIPREANVVIIVKPDDGQKLAEKIGEWDKIFKNEFRVSDPDVSVKAEKLGRSVDKVFSRDTATRVIQSLILMPNGIQTMSMDIPGLVESSTNLGVVTTTESDVTFESAVRSSVRSLKYSIANQIKTLSTALGAEFTSGADYPEWEYSPDSKLREVFERVYNEMFGKKLEIATIHAGLECGLFKEKAPHLDMVSIGPNMYDVHTPNEHISISSIERTWDYLLAVLKELK